MKPKYQVFIYNFLGFAVLFLIFRFGLSLFLTIDTFYLALIAAIAASVLAPKFTVIKTERKEKILMKWIFIRGFKEL